MFGMTCSRALSRSLGTCQTVADTPTMQGSGPFEIVGHSFQARSNSNGHASRSRSGAG